MEDAIASEVCTVLREWTAILKNNFQVELKNWKPCTFESFVVNVTTSFVQGDKHNYAVQSDGF